MLGGASVCAHADDSLLDPSLLFNNRKPASPGASSRLGGASSDSKSLGPGYARAMAVSVVSSLDSLTNAAAERAADVNRFAKRVAALNAELSALRDKMAATLDEYRQGLFCSGCGKTKSEILAAGQTFPHSGQTVIRATPEQIAAKERELQAPIDRDAREQKDVEAQRRKALGEREEALAQIDAGLALWGTSVSFETLLIDLRESQAEAHFKAEKAKLDQQLSVARAAKPAPGDTAAAKLVARLSDAQSQLNLEWARSRRDLHAARSDAADHSASDQDTLNAYLGRGALQSLNVTAARAAFVSQSSGFNALGGLYRMGAFDPARSSETLPSVETFITEFQSSPAPKGPLAPTTPQPLDSVREKLKELMKCDPAVDGPCNKAPKNGGSGIRG